MENKNTRGEIVWKDNKILDWTGLIFSSFFFLLSSFFFLTSKPNNAIYRIFLIPIILFSIFLLYTQIRKRAIFITSEGIRMGNLVYWADDKIFLKQKPTFFEWDKIKYIYLLKKSYRQGIYGGRDFYHIHLKTKSSQLYDCLVYEPRGFIQTLKKLNKQHLLSRDSEHITK